MVTAGVARVEQCTEHDTWRHWMLEGRRQGPRMTEGDAKKNADPNLEFGTSEREEVRWNRDRKEFSGARFQTRTTRDLL